MKTCLPLAAMFAATTALSLSAQPAHHGSSSYSDSLYAPQANEGDFVRMFPLDVHGLKPHPSPVYDLRRLGRADGPMEETDQDPVGDSRIEAGLTFFGQFVDHDITLDVTTSLEAAADIGALRNFRTADLDLDCVYGDGPEATPWLYDGPLLVEGAPILGGDRFDLARVPGLGTALIGDPRNDENFVIAQIQAVFIAFHNKVAREYLKKAAIEEGVLDETASQMGVEAIADPAKRRAIQVESFEQARDHVIHYYHRILAEYFLPKVIGVGRTIDIANNGRRYYMTEFTDRPTMPVEFSAAAYRYGHSQVRQSYQLKLSEAPRDLFREGMQNGFSAVTDEQALDFALFFPVPGREDVDYQPTRKLDPKLPEILFHLDRVGVVPSGGLGSLAARNLNRGRTFRLPGGEDLFALVAQPRFDDGDFQPVETGDAALASLQIEAAKMGYALVTLRRGLTDWRRVEQLDTRKAAEVTEDDLRPFTEASAAVRGTLSLPSSPLWFYILHEAAEWPVAFSESASSQHVWPVAHYLPSSVGYLSDGLATNPGAYGLADPEFAGGQVLGPVGGTIVGEVILGLIDHYRETTGKGLDLVTAGDIALPVPQEFSGFGERMTFGDIVAYIGWDSEI